MKPRVTARLEQIPVEERVLVVAPVGRDAPMIAAELHKAGIGAEVRPDIPSLCEGLEEGAGAAVICEEALPPRLVECLASALQEQPAWSDFPVILLTSGGRTTRVSYNLAQQLEPRGNVTMLERPLRVLTLVSAVQSALRARRRQYEVRRLLTQSQRAVQQRDQFIAMLSHELRNPLGAARTSLAVLSHADGNDPSLIDEHRQIISRQMSHVARLVDDLLDVVRVTTGKITLHRKPVDLRQVARQTLQALSAVQDAQHHRIIHDEPEEPLMVMGDEVRLEQVVGNLLTNAIKYTPPDGTIRLSVRCEGDSAVVQVIDTGMGIPADVLPDIFEPFVQADQSLDRSRGGLGIGLSVVRSLVKLHGGQIHAHSDGRGCGSTFTLTLSIAQDARAEEKRPDEVPGSVSRRVLLIEDGADARRALSALLSLWGHRVEVAEDGPGGLEAALSWKPDVALVDIGLPGMNGYEVAERIRRELGDQIHLVALTGYGQAEDRRRAEQAGFDRHMVKPVDPDELSRMLTNGRH